MKRKTKEFIALLFLVAVLIFVFFNKDDITRYIIKNYFIDRTIIINGSNEYTKGINYIKFKQTEDFTPSNKEELKNLFYTVLDKGWTHFTFYFEEEYTTYLDDIDEMTNDGTFTAINNYVHPYNSYKSINFNINEMGIATIDIEKNYSDEEIAIIETIIDTIIETKIDKNLSTTQKIKAFHDFIIERTVYDIEEAQNENQDAIKNSLSYNAYNVVVNGIGLCGGYSDTLAIYLNKLGINNFKIASNNHVWNALHINNEWLHIDMTWDDPVTSNNTQILIYDYYMINTNQLKNLDQEKHNFDTNLYLEAN